MKISIKFITMISKDVTRNYKYQSMTKSMKKGLLKIQGVKTMDILSAMRSKTRSTYCIIKMKSSSRCIKIYPMTLQFRSRYSPAVNKFPSTTQVILSTMNVSMLLAKIRHRHYTIRCMQMDNHSMPRAMITRAWPLNTSSTNKTNCLPTQKDMTSRCIMIKITTSHPRILLRLKQQKLEQINTSI